MKRIIYIILFFIIGFVLTPIKVYACNSESKKTERLEDKNEKKSCCTSEKNSCGENGKDCEGKCGNSSCQCPTSFLHFTIPFFDKFLHVKTIVHQTNFYFKEIHISSGFHFIWVPPNIG